MGFQVGSACYDTALQAAQVAASSAIGAVVDHGGSAFTVNVSGVTSSVISYTFTPVAGGTALTLDAPYTAQPCNLLQSSDALAIGWLIGAAWLGVYGVMFMARALRGESEGSYGNS